MRALDLVDILIHDNEAMDRLRMALILSEHRASAERENDIIETDGEIQVSKSRFTQSFMYEDEEITIG